MSRRRRMSRKSSKRNFRANAGSHPANSPRRNMRGGFRL